MFLYHNLISKCLRLNAIRINATHYSIMKISNKRQLQQRAFNHPPDNNFKDFMKLYKEYTKKMYSILVNDKEEVREGK